MMKGPGLVRVVVCCLLTVGGISRSGADQSTAKPTGVTLEASLAPGRDRLRLRLEIFNGSERDLWVNKRMLWNPESMAADAREIVLDVRDRGGRPVFNECKPNNGEAGPADYVVLFHHEFVGRLLPLDCLSLKHGEHYTVVAHYLDGNKGVKAIVGAERLSWEVVSKPIEILVP